MYSAILFVIITCVSVRSDGLECETTFASFMEQYNKCFTSTSNVITKPIFFKLQELYNEEITEEDFLQYKIQNCPRLHNGIDCVLAIDVTEEEKTCTAVSSILQRFREEKVAYGYICDLDNQQFFEAISDGGVNCWLAQQKIGICMKNQAKTHDGVIDRCEALKIKKECLGTGEEACTNPKFSTHVAGIIDALQKDSKCTN